MSVFGVISIIAIIVTVVIGIGNLAVVAFLICCYKKMQNHILENKTGVNEGIVFTENPKE